MQARLRSYHLLFLLRAISRNAENLLLLGVYPKYIEKLWIFGRFSEISRGTSAIDGSSRNSKIASYAQWRGKTFGVDQELKLWLKYFLGGIGLYAAHLIIFSILENLISNLYLSRRIIDNISCFLGFAGASFLLFGALPGAFVAASIAVLRARLPRIRSFFASLFFVGSLWFLPSAIYLDPYSLLFWIYSIFLLFLGFCTLMKIALPQKFVFFSIALGAICLVCYPMLRPEDLRGQCFGAL